jgi:ABC-type multidrug transport system fused ATPase/permease subunit
MQQDIGFFDVTQIGELTSRMTQDCQQVVDQAYLNVMLGDFREQQRYCLLFFMTVHVSSWEYELKKIFKHCYGEVGIRKSDHQKAVGLHLQVVHCLKQFRLGECSIKLLRSAACVG